MIHAFRTAAGALLLAGALTTGTSYAQTAPAPTPAPAQGAAPAAPALPPASEASRREARALGEKLGWEAQVRGIINSVRTAVIVNLAQVNKKTPQEMIAVVDDVMMPDFVGQAGSLTDAIIEAWAQAFTPEELRNLRSFYNTPLGEKLLRTIPQLNTRINQAGQAWTQHVYQMVQQKHADEFAKRGLKFTP